MSSSNDKQNQSIKKSERKKSPTSAAQKILISFCAFMLLLLVVILIYAIVIEKNTKITTNPVDSLSTTQTHALTTSARYTSTTTALTVSETSTDTETSASTSYETTSSVSASSVQTTAVTTKKITGIKEYTVPFEIQLPQNYSGNYTIKIIYNYKGTVITISDIKLPGDISVKQELTSLTADEDVSADIYLINNTNSLRALIGNANFDFAHSSAEYSGFDITSAFEAVQ